MCLFGFCRYLEPVNQLCFTFLGTVRLENYQKITIKINSLILGYLQLFKKIKLYAFCTYHLGFIEKACKRWEFCLFFLLFYSVHISLPVTNLELSKKQFFWISDTFHEVKRKRDKKEVNQVTCPVLLQLLCSGTIYVLECWFLFFFSVLQYYVFSLTSIMSHGEIG